MGGHVFNMCNRMHLPPATCVGIAVGLAHLHDPLYAGDAFRILLQKLPLLISPNSIIDLDESVIENLVEIVRRIPELADGKISGAFFSALKMHQMRLASMYNQAPPNSLEPNLNQGFMQGGGFGGLNSGPPSAYNNPIDGNDVNPQGQGMRNSNSNSFDGLWKNSGPGPGPGPADVQMSSGFLSQLAERRESSMGSIRPSRINQINMSQEYGNSIVKALEAYGPQCCATVENFSKT